MAASEPISILTGGPGTGKSTIMEAVAELASGLDSGPLFLAGPTGLASRRLADTTGRDARTVHRTLRARLNPKGGRIFAANAESSEEPPSELQSLLRISHPLSCS